MRSIEKTRRLMRPHDRSNRPLLTRYLPRRPSKRHVPLGAFVINGISWAIALGIGWGIFLLLRIFAETTPYGLWTAVSIIAVGVAHVLLNLIFRLVTGLPRLPWSPLWLIIAAVGHWCGVWIWTMIGVGTVAGWLCSVAVVGTLLGLWWLGWSRVRFKWRRISTLLTIGLTLAWLIFCAVCAFMVYRAVVIPPTVALNNPASMAPTPKELDTSLKRANRFLTGLYKPDGYLPPNKNIIEDGSGRGLTTKAGSSGTISEYYGLPIRVRTERDARYRLLGDTSVRVKPLIDGANSEVSIISFNLSRGMPPKNEAEEKNYQSLRNYKRDQEVVLNAQLEVDWNYSPTHIQIRFRSLQRTPPRVRLFFRLGNEPLGWWGTYNTGQERTFLVSKRSRSLFQSFRYTSRHATMAGEYFFDYHRDARARSLGTSLRTMGFRKGFDLYAPLWNQDSRESLYSLWSAQTYVDCKNIPSRTRDSYPYKSKICSLPVNAYRWLAVPDPLIPTSLAVHAMHLSNDPDTKYEDLDLRPRTPRTWARRLEKQYRDLNTNGITRCNPLRCEPTRFSSIRTAYFGALEAELGYKYGDKTSQTYADRIARNMLRLQVGPNSMIPVSQRLVYYRPIQRGSYFAIYNKDFYNHQLNSFSSNVTESLFATLDMPREYMGLLPSNGETTFAVYAFLIKYRCLKYKIGCDTAPETLEPVERNFKQVDRRPYNDVFRHLLEPTERTPKPEPAAPNNPTPQDQLKPDKNPESALD